MLFVLCFRNISVQFLNDFLLFFRNLSHHGSFRSTSSSTMSSVMSSTSFWTKLSNVFQERKEKIVKSWSREKKSWNREKNHEIVKKILRNQRLTNCSILVIGHTIIQTKKFVRKRHNEAKYFLELFDLR